MSLFLDRLSMLTNLVQQYQLHKASSDLTTVEEAKAALTASLAAMTGLKTEGDDLIAEFEGLFTSVAAAAMENLIWEGSQTNELKTTPAALDIMCPFVPEIFSNLWFSDPASEVIDSTDGSASVFDPTLMNFKAAVPGYERMGALSAGSFMALPPGAESTVVLSAGVPIISIGDPTGTDSGPRAYIPRPDYTRITVHVSSLGAPEYDALTDDFKVRAVKLFFDGGDPYIAHPSLDATGVSLVDSPASTLVVNDQLTGAPWTRFTFEVATPDPCAIALVPCWDGVGNGSLASEQRSIYMDGIGACALSMT